MRRTLLLGLEILDRQLVDRDEELCGKVDDVELERAGSELCVAALLTGPAAWRDRLPSPLRRPLGRFIPGEVTRIDWKEVVEADSAVRLKIAVASLKDRRVELRPGNADRLRLSSLLGSRLVGREGRGQGTVHEVEAEESDGTDDLCVSRLWFGRQGLLRRLGLARGGDSAAAIPWKEVADWDVGEVRLRRAEDRSAPIG